MRKRAPALDVLSTVTVAVAAWGCNSEGPPYYHQEPVALSSCLSPDKLKCMKEVLNICCAEGLFWGVKWRCSSFYLLWTAASYFLQQLFTCHTPRALRHPAYTTADQYYSTLSGSGCPKHVLRHTDPEIKKQNKHSLLQSVRVLSWLFSSVLYSSSLPLTFSERKSSALNTGIIIKNLWFVLSDVFLLPFGCLTACF